MSRLEKETQLIFEKGRQFYKELLKDYQQHFSEDKFIHIQILDSSLKIQRQLGISLSSKTETTKPFFWQNKGERERTQDCVISTKYKTRYKTKHVIQENKTEYRDRNSVQL